MQVPVRSKDVIVITAGLAGPPAIARTSGHDEATNKKKNAKKKADSEETSGAGNSTGNSVGV